MNADRELWVTTEGKVVEAGDPEGDFLLAAEGRPIRDRDVERYGLEADDGGKVTQKGDFSEGQPVPSSAADPEPENADTDEPKPLSEGAKEETSQPLIEGQPEETGKPEEKEKPLTGPESLDLTPESAKGGTAPKPSKSDKNG